MWFSIKNDNLGLKLKILKILEIHPKYKLTDRGDWTWYWFLECVWMCWRYDGGSFGLFDSLEAWLDDSEALLSIFWWISWARGVTRDFGVNPPLIRRVISALEADLKNLFAPTQNWEKRGLSS